LGPHPGRRLALHAGAGRRAQERRDRPAVGPKAVRTAREPSHPAPGPSSARTHPPAQEPGANPPHIVDGSLSSRPARLACRRPAAHGRGGPCIVSQLLILAVSGFVAQLIDGALGMGYGVTSTTLLLTLGLAPATVSASVHAGEVVTTLVSGIAHWRFGNVDRAVV